MASGSGKYVSIPGRTGRLVPQPKQPGPNLAGVVYDISSSPGEPFGLLSDVDVLVALRLAADADVSLNITSTVAVDADTKFGITGILSSLADLKLLVTGPLAAYADVDIIVLHPVDPDTDESGVRGDSVRDPALEFLGKGLKFPFTFQRRSGGTQISTATSSDHAHIHESIRQILGTRKGERFLRPEFGTSLHELIFEPNDRVLYGLIRHEVTDALDQWEPRVTVTDVEVGPGDDEHLVLVNISYRLISSQVEGNMVYPFFRELE